MWSKALAHLCLMGLLAGGGAWAQNLVYITDFGKTRITTLSGRTLQESREEADKYARVSHIKVLKDGDADEVRLWYSWATFDLSTNGIGTIGYLVTAGHARKCRVSYPRTSVVPRSGRCSSYAPQQNPKDIAASLIHLVPFANSSMSCGVEDGGWVLIDLVVNGKRSVLYASNPGSCPGDGPKLVSRLMNAVGER